MNVFPFERVPLADTDFCPQLSVFTISFHYEGHYRKYTDTLNELIERAPQYQNIPIERLINSRDENIRFNAGGYFNHSLYFSALGKCGSMPSERFNKLIDRSFGSWEEFRQRFENGALNIRGSGYVWLCQHGNVLKIGTTANQNTPSADRLKPLLCCDMWEHAYYLDYQNRRQEYLNAWFELVDWQKVEEQIC